MQNERTEQKQGVSLGFGYPTAYRGTPSGEIRS